MQNQDPKDPSEKFRRLIDSDSETQAGPLAEAGKSEQPARPIRRPEIDENGMPLPRRVEEIDVGATRVSPAALEQTTGPLTHRARRPKPGADRRLPSLWRRAAGCLLRTIIVLVFITVALILIAAAVGVYEYYTIAASLPSVDDLAARASQFETTRILDRNGDLLYEINDPNAGQRTYVTLDHISPVLVAATIATEDKDFYTHPGFDPTAIVRAFWQNLSSRQTVSGASTITQQLARALLLTPEERSQETYGRKIREAILATEIERRYTKNEILELYLNEIYYGNLDYGVEAAAETYFNTTAENLTLGQAAFLAGLPQAPAVYDIYINRTGTLARLQEVLVLMYQLSQERNCITVSNSPQRVCVDVAGGAQAIQEMNAYPFTPPVANMRYPHWVQYIRTQLEDRYGPQTIYRSGFTVYTTLDPSLQDAAQQIVTDQINSLASKHVTDGALVAIQPATGEILAMVGSPDFYSEANAGQINMAVSPTRQPGSSIKPLNYLAAFEKGWTPATLIWDVPSEFPPSGNPNDPHPPYVPTDFDKNYRGPVTVRTALANSYNIPAVKTLQFVGIYPDPNNPQAPSMIGMAQRMGITSLTRDDYGLSLTLGGGEVSLLELTGAYAVIANGGVRIPPVPILKIVDFSGKTIYQYQPPQGEQVISPQHAYLMTSILSDNAARVPVFGANSILNLPFQAAVKTGTSNDSRDNWALGYTPDLAVGVWVGNADDTPMLNTTGITGAGPIWAKFMMAGIQQLKGGIPTPFVKPDGIIQRSICTVSGTEPSQWCPSTREEVFAADQPPLPASDDLWQQVQVDTWTGLLASPDCSQFTDQRMAINVTDPWARKWIQEDDAGKQWARTMGFTSTFFVPDRKCAASDPRPQVQFIGLNEGQVITQTPLDITVIADATAGFKSFSLDYGLGVDPPSRIPLLGDTSAPASAPTKVFTWDLSSVPANQVTLHLHVTGDNGYAEQTIHLTLNLPTPTPTQTPSSTDTRVPTPTKTPILTPTATPTPPLPTATPTPPLPTATPTPPLPTATPTPPLPTATPSPPPPTATPSPPPPTATSTPPPPTDTPTPSDTT